MTLLPYEPQQILEQIYQLLKMTKLFVALTHLKLFDLDVPPFSCLLKRDDTICCIANFSPIALFQVHTYICTYVKKMNSNFYHIFDFLRIHLCYSSIQHTCNSMYSVWFWYRSFLFDSRVQHYSLAAFIYCVKPINRTNFLGSSA